MSIDNSYLGLDEYVVKTTISEPLSLQECKIAKLPNAYKSTFSHRQNQFELNYCIYSLYQVILYIPLQHLMICF